MLQPYSDPPELNLHRRSWLRSPISDPLPVRTQPVPPAVITFADLALFNDLDSSAPSWIQTDILRYRLGSDLSERSTAAIGTVLELSQFELELESIVRRISSGELNLQPDFRRGEIWDKRRRRHLIDSLLREWHVPAIHIFRDRFGGQIPW